MAELLSLRHVSATQLPTASSPANPMPILFDGQTVIGRQLSSAALRD
jgi:hypothetical protein